MDDRLKQLLRLVVEDVIETGEPVGSQRLVESYALDVSPATIRNWFAELEEEGYIIQPHTSSGRVPTEKGYRVYLDEIMEEKPLRQRDRHDLEAAMNVPGDTPKNIKAFAKASAEILEEAILVGRKNAETFYTGLSHLFSQPEFQDLNRIVNFGEVLDRLDDVIQVVRRQRFDEPIALIGRDCPFGPVCGAVVMTLHDGTLISVLGPMRMDYRHTFALLKTARELMNT